MSGPIRKLLGPTKAQLQGYLKDSKLIFASSIDENLDEEELVEDLLQRLSTNVALLEKCNDEWKSLLGSKDLKGDSKTVQEKEYAWAIEGEGGIIELQLDAREVIARLQARLNRILRAQERSGRRLFPNSYSNKSRRHQDANPQMKLPKLDLPTFNGNLLGWQEFWDIFDSTIHQQSILNVVKFSYLKSSLRGAAASAVNEISVTDGNYSIVIALLKEKFGRKEAIVEALYSQLQILPISQNRFMM